MIDKTIQEIILEFKKRLWISSILCTKTTVLTKQKGVYQVTVKRLDGVTLTATTRRIRP